MPLGWKYSVEQQVTGSEYIGGIQLQIAPVSATASSSTHSRTMNKRSSEIDLLKSPFEIGLEPDQIISMSDLSSALKYGKYRESQIKGVNPQLFPMNEDKCRPVFVGEVIQRAASGAKVGRRFVLKPIKPPTLII